MCTATPKKRDQSTSPEGGLADPPLTSSLHRHFAYHWICARKERRTYNRFAQNKLHTDTEIKRKNQQETNGYPFSGSVSMYLPPGRKDPSIDYTLYVMFRQYPQRSEAPGRGKLVDLKLYPDLSEIYSTLKSTTCYLKSSTVMGSCAFSLPDPSSTTG